MWNGEWAVHRTYMDVFRACPHFQPHNSATRHRSALLPSTSTSATQFSSSHPHPFQHGQPCTTRGGPLPTPLSAILTEPVRLAGARLRPLLLVSAVGPRRAPLWTAQRAPRDRADRGWVQLDRARRPPLRRDPAYATLYSGVSPAWGADARSARGEDGLRGRGRRGLSQGVVELSVSRWVITRGMKGQLCYHGMMKLPSSLLLSMDAMCIAISGPSRILVLTPISNPRTALQRLQRRLHHLLLTPPPQGRRVCAPPKRHRRPMDGARAQPLRRGHGPMLQLAHALPRQRGHRHDLRPAECEHRQARPGKLSSAPGAARQRAAAANAHSQAGEVGEKGVDAEVPHGGG